MYLPRKLRAIRTLAQLGLILVDYNIPTAGKTKAILPWSKRGQELGLKANKDGSYEYIPPQRITRSYQYRAVALSPLGAAFVDNARATLENGQRIRWADYRDGLALAGQTPEQ